MSTQMLERPDSVTVAVELPVNDEHVAHTVCHCNMDVAWCGADVSNESEAPEDAPSCWLCDVLVEMYVDVCPRGCSCTCDEEPNHYYCGLCTCEEDESTE
jgi:hypothetical protein